MKIAILGAGAIGSVAAAQLVKAGIDVTLIGRESQIEAIERKGLKIKKADNEETVSLPTAKNLKKNYDLVIFTVKTQDLSEAYQQNRDYFEKSLILTTQNGVQADNLLSCHFDQEVMISSIVMFGATYIEPGVVTLNFPGDWIIGKPFTPNDWRSRSVVAVLQKAFTVVVVDDIMGMKWLKLFVNFNNCIPALIGKSMQETFADLDLCRLSIRLLKEGVDIVEKSGVEMISLPQFPVQKIQGLRAMPEDQAASIIHKTLTSLSKEPLYGSILQSIMRERASEIDFINGEVVHMASHIGMKAPLNSRIVDLVHAVEQKKKFWSVEEVKRELGLLRSARVMEP